MDIPRSSGVLLHPLSLAGDWPCGTMGEEARAFIDSCSASGLGWWQILPLGPTAFGDSPYQSPSAFAGNPYLISPRLLIEEGLISEGESARYRSGLGAEDTLSARNTPAAIDYGRLFSANAELMRTAWQNYRDSEAPRIGPRRDFAKFKARQAYWLDDFTRFMAIKESEGFRAWNEWPQGLRFRDPRALEEFEARHRDDIQRIQFTQFLFFSQWRKLREYASARGVKIVGDIPIFAAFDSADVWAHPELFILDERLEPARIAGVPPDYFTATGQLWGNPLYRWPAHASQRYAWWIARVRHSLQLVDALRIDHFRGFEAYWSVDAGEPTAERGHWEKGPGSALFSALEAELDELPIIAEDLGFITPEVIALRDSLGFPGMRILQFAFETDHDNLDYPHNYPQHCVAYTGTHDNDTARGWFVHAAPPARARARAYLGATARTISWKMIRAVWASAASLAIAPMQDFLGAGSEARMNLPGTSGWWRWRMTARDTSARLAHEINRLSRACFRASGGSIPQQEAHSVPSATTTPPHQTNSR